MISSHGVPSQVALSIRCRILLDRMNTLGMEVRILLDGMFSLCDGSVRMMTFDVTETVHRRLANRNDGEVVEVAGP